MMLDRNNDKLRKQIANEGKKFVENITYSQRLDKMIKKVFEITEKKPTKNEI